MLSAMKITSVSTIFATLPTFAAATSYGIIKDYSGSTFFDDWTYYGNFDNLTNGDAIFVTRDVATSSNLTFINNAGNAIIKVDNTTNIPFNIKRNTVRITSNEQYPLGSLWIADMLHVPYGCSVWPAWWSQAPAWPVGGEIDTFEGVNLMTNNQVALHTSHGCTIANAVQTSTLVNSTDCSFDDNNNQGCVVTVPTSSSFGAGFAAAGGGVYVTEFAEDAINIWFFTRSSVPSSLNGNSSSIDTSSFGTPTVNYPSSSSCDINTFFTPQNLIFDITLCGDFAGNAAIYNETCSGICYTDNVIGNGSNYATAYFEIQHVRIFSNSSNGSSGSGSSGGSGGSGSTNGTNISGTIQQVGLGTRVLLGLSLSVIAAAAISV